MSYKVSDRVCLRTPDLEGAKAHFLAKGMEVAEEGAEAVELLGDGVRLRIVRGPELGPIMELLVPDLGMAQQDLAWQGWSVLEWEGREGPCLMVNPMGTVFLLREDPAAFEEEAGTE